VFLDVAPIQALIDQEAKLSTSLIRHRLQFYPLAVVEANALVRMFEQALKVVSALPATYRPELLGRLDAVRGISHNFGYGVGDDIDDLLADGIDENGLDA